MSAKELRPQIPLRSLTAVRQEAEKKFRGDDERVATTTLRGLTFRGVNLSSRYEKAADYEEMLTIVESIPNKKLPFVDSIFCDSKAGAVYVIKLSYCSEEELHEIGRKASAVLLKYHRGHNEIQVSSPSGDVFMGAYWGELDEE